MNPIVCEFLESGKAASRAKFENERDSLLLSLGLVETVKEFSPSGKRDVMYNKLDDETGRYYRLKRVPVSVTDEEFEEIKKVVAASKKSAPVKKTSFKYLDNGAEDLLKWLNISVTALLFVFIIINFLSEFLWAVKHDIYDGLWACLCDSIGYTVVILMSFAFINVILNISNNLHKLNAKTK